MWGQERQKATVVASWEARRFLLEPENLSRTGDWRSGGRASICDRAWVAAKRQGLRVNASHG